MDKSRDAGGSPATRGRLFNIRDTIHSSLSLQKLHGLSCRQLWGFLFSAIFEGMSFLDAGVKKVRTSREHSVM